MTVFCHADLPAATINNGLFMHAPGFAVIAHYATTETASRDDEKSG